MTGGAVHRVTIHSDGHGSMSDPGEAHDTPTERATINQLSVDELDAMLTALRERRLARVHKLEELAKIKSDEAQITSWLKFERAYKIAKRALDKLEEQDQKVEALMQKVRMAAMVVRLEVGADEDATD
jgi:exonuclease VII small subunit